MVVKPNPRGVIKIRNEGDFWGVYIPNTNEMLISKRLGDVKQRLLTHFSIEKLPRPDVLVVSDDEEYNKKCLELRKAANSDLVYEEGKRNEVEYLINLFGEEGLTVKQTAEFFQMTQKRVKEILSSDNSS